MMAWFLTEYRAWPDEALNDKSPIGAYSSFIWASSLRQARRLAKRRRIGERVMGQSLGRSLGKRRPYSPPSIMLRKRRLTNRQKLDVVHGAVFLMFLLARQESMGAMGVAAILGDEGLLHSLVHSLTTGWPRRKAVTRMMEDAERMVPGYWPHKKQSAR